MAKIDTEIKQILDIAYSQAVQMIKDKREVVDKVADALIAKESLDQDEFEAIVGKKEK